MHQGEGADGQALWRAVRMDGVVAFVRQGVRKHPLQAARAEDRLTLYVMERARCVDLAFVDEGSYDALADREGVWTVHTDGRDRACLGWTQADAPPEDGTAYRVVSVADNAVGRGAVRHLRIGL